MSSFLLASQLFVSIILVTLILLQPGADGRAGFMSGGNETYHTRKGVEKLLYYATFVFLILFTFNSLALLMI